MVLTDALIVESQATLGYPVSYLALEDPATFDDDLAGNMRGGEGGSNRFQPPCGVPCTKQILISFPWGTIREIRELTIRL